MLFGEMALFGVCFLIQFLVALAINSEKEGYEGNTVDIAVEEQIDNEEQVGIFGPFTGHFFIGRVINTKWCGPGHVARSIYDLGGNSEVDTCCRQHDLCIHSISPGETKYGLTNNRLFTSVHCDCDEAFRFCLEAIGSTTSRAVVIAYSATFPQCFELQYSVYCTANNGKRCFHYVTGRVNKADDDEKEHYQWLDSPFNLDEEPQYVPGTITFTAIPPIVTSSPSPTTVISESTGSKLDSRLAQSTNHI
ncbi:phospholipase A(2)-like [Bradysia coprophila]|uniref:phospholipase A(2)-like n=1 Tax=Bradysia coprophila TaxID=38358 RepID=UPI00187DAEEF|nr:phospholipase A(2)-like [Bradysia coprophila]